MAIPRFPFFSSSHSSTGVSQVKTLNKIQRETAIVMAPITPQPKVLR